MLGVSPSASEAEIKKGYRKAALKYHPDKPTGDTDKFKEISEAFEILSNKDKRQVYDQFGLEAARHGGPMPGSGGAGGNPFAGAGGSPFGFGGPGGGGTTFSFGGSPGGGNPFSSADAFKIFEQFAGSGGMGGDDFGSFGGGGFGGSPFGGAGGGGARTRSSRMPGGFGGAGGGFQEDGPEPDTVTIQLPCKLEELYHGKLKKLNVTRKNHTGQPEKRIIEVNVKPGWKAGTKITFKGQGDWTPNGRQTIQFIIEEKPHPIFKREDNNLIVTIPLSFKESLLGFKKEIQTIDGRTINIDRSTPISPTSESKYPGLGMPISKHPGTKGDLIVKFKVDYPYYLTPQQKEAINSAF